jgi:hypothetical protein
MQLNQIYVFLFVKNFSHVEDQDLKKPILIQIMNIDKSFCIRIFKSLIILFIYKLNIHLYICMYQYHLFIYSIKKYQTHLSSFKKH